MQDGGVAKVIPILGALALGAQKMLPILQQSYNAWTQIKATQVSLQDTLDLLDQPLPSHAYESPIQAITFKNKINLKKVSFCYDEKTSAVLKELNLTIKKGDRVGFVGVTGSGKSTLIDIIMALLHPSKGSLIVDNEIITTANSRGWQDHIAHVPQAIFLSDSSINENIAFGIAKEKIDHQRVRKVAKQAQIADIIETWPSKYETLIGEKGIRLSGGQRQRIGIARALYKKADVIILDEATSALDNKTETEVMQAIENLSKDITILIIAHRLTTLKNCTQIVELVDGRIKRKFSHKDLEVFTK
jgi:ATP-binding cassette subfamily B protein